MTGTTTDLGAELQTQVQAWEHLKRNASPALVADAILGTETGPRELKAIFAQNPPKVYVKPCAGCGQTLHWVTDATAEDGGTWYHATSYDLLKCCGTI